MVKTAKRKSGSQPPISAHPVFPVIVALWFAALFGIGSLLLPNILIEKVVVATGLPSIVAATAPPIGFTAKLIISLAAATFGVLAGLFIARKVVASQADETQESSEFSDEDEQYVPTKRPIVATEELGEEGLGPVPDAEDYDPSRPAGKPPLPGRRRALSVTDDSGPSEYLASVPIPGAPDEYAEPVIGEEQGIDEFTGEEAFRPDAFEKPPETDACDVAETPETDVSEHGEEIAVPEVAGTVAAGRLFDAPPSGAFVENGQTPRFAVAAEPADTPRESLQLAMPSEDPTMSSDPEASGYNPFADRLQAPNGEANAEQAQTVPQQVFGKGPVAPFAAPADAATNVASPSTALTASQDADSAPLDRLTMSELITRFARSMEASASGEQTAVHAEAAASAAATAVAVQDDTASMPFAFQRGGSDAEEPAAKPVAAEADTADAAFTLPPFSAPTEPPESGEQPAVPVPFAATSSVEPAAGNDGETAPNPFDIQPAGEVPTALLPLDLGNFEDEDEDGDDPFESGLSLGLSESSESRMFNRPDDASVNPFAPPENAASSAMAPSPFTQPTTGDEGSEESSEADDEAYSSLLSMKSPLGPHHEFVRVEDEEDIADGPEQVVTFPGQDQTDQQAAASAQAPETAASGPSNATRLFDAPEGAQASTGGLARAVPTMPKASQVDPAETEKALREALEKLQRMSGAA